MMLMMNIINKNDSLFPVSLVSSTFIFTGFADIFKTNISMMPCYKKKLGFFYSAEEKFLNKKNRLVAKVKFHLYF